MTQSIQTALEILKGSGYRELPSPLLVGSAQFPFSAALKGSETSNDLVVLAATAEIEAGQIVRLVSALCRTLDHLRSRKSVTLVLTGAALAPEAQNLLERQARVLGIGVEDSPAEIEKALAVLLPLTLPEVGRQAAEPLDVVMSCLGEEITDEHNRLIESGVRGSDEVKNALRRYIDEALDVQHDHREQP